MSSQQTVTISLEEYTKLKKLQKRKSKKTKLTKKEIKARTLKNKQKKEYKKIKTHELANQRASELRKNSTLSEKKFKVYLKLNNYNYVFQYPVYPKKSFFIVDFFLPKERLVIEIDGGYHKDRKISTKDKLRDKIILEECGFKTLRITNETVEKENELYFKNLIESYLK